MISCPNGPEGARSKHSQELSNRLDSTTTRARNSRVVTSTMDVMSNHNVELSQEAMNFHNVESVRCDPIGLTSVGALALFFFYNEK